MTFSPHSITCTSQSPQEHTRDEFDIHSAKGNQVMKVYIGFSAEWVSSIKLRDKDFRITQNDGPKKAFSLPIFG